MRDRTTSPSTLRLDLTLPSTKVGVGPLSYDPLKEMLGIEPRAALAPVLRAQPYIRTTDRTATEVFPLGLAPGVCVVVPLGSFGEFALANDRGQLALTVPIKASPWVGEQLGRHLVAGPTPVADRDGVRRVAVSWLRLAPGQRAALSLSLFGELGLEAP